MEWGRRDEYFKTSSYPVGFRFKPTEEELTGFYLLNKIHGQIDDLNNIIPECDLYGDKNPWELWETFRGTKCANEDEFYCFTKLKKKSLKGSRVDRRTGLGTWDAEAANSPIYDFCDHTQNKRTIGHRKRFRFEKSGTQHDGGWIMMEYTLDKSLLPSHMIHDAYVLCKVKKNERAEAAQKRKQQAMQEVVMMNRDNAVEEMNSSKRMQIDMKEEANQNTRLQEQVQEQHHRIQIHESENNNNNNQVMDLPPIHHDNGNEFLDAPMQGNKKLSIDELLDLDWASWPSVLGGM